jgi:hypothetical protein
LSGDLYAKRDDVIKIKSEEKQFPTNTDFSGDLYAKRDGVIKTKSEEKQFPTNTDFSGDLYAKRDRLLGLGSTPQPKLKRSQTRRAQLAQGRVSGLGFRIWGIGSNRMQILVPKP